MSATKACGDKRCYNFEEDDWESLQVVTKKLRCGCSPLDYVTKGLDQLHLRHADGDSGYAITTATGKEYAEHSSAHDNIPITNCSHQQIEALTQDVALKEKQQETEPLMRESVTLKEQQQQTDKALAQENVKLKELNRNLFYGAACNHWKLQQMLLKYEELQKDYDKKTKEVEHLKKEASRLEKEKYALTIRVKQAEEGNSMPARSNPYVF